MSGVFDFLARYLDTSDRLKARIIELFGEDALNAFTFSVSSIADGSEFTAAIYEFSATGDDPRAAIQGLIDELACVERGIK